MDTFEKSQQCPELTSGNILAFFLPVISFIYLSTEMCVYAYVHNYKNKMENVIHVLYPSLFSISSSCVSKEGIF